MAFIQCRGLTKTFRTRQKSPGLLASLKNLIVPEYKELHAVHHLDLEVDEGEVLAFIGPNGAGKSTTIKMLTGILVPTGGEAQVLGYTPWRDRELLSHKIGTVFGQKSQLWFHLPPMDTFHLLGQIYEIEHRTFLKRVAKLTRLFELTDFLRTPTRNLSLGQRMRAEVAASLLHAPRVLFLDEPTIGLDVVARSRIRELIRELNSDEKMTVFLTSHDMGDIEQLSSRVVVIHHGRCLLDSTVANLKANYFRTRRVELVLREPMADFAPPAGVTLTGSGTHLTLTVQLDQISIESVITQVLARASVLDIIISDPPLEEIIAHLYQVPA